MSDIMCIICNEPYDSYYVYYEMESSERKRFLKGKGCECCNGVHPEDIHDRDGFGCIIGGTK